jgi:hypothetical protein
MTPIVRSFQYKGYPVVIIKEQSRGKILIDNNLRVSEITDIDRLCNLAKDTIDKYLVELGEYDYSYDVHNSSY